MLFHCRLVSNYCTLIEWFKTCWDKKLRAVRHGTSQISMHFNPCRVPYTPVTHTPVVTHGLTILDVDARQNHAPRTPASPSVVFDTCNLLFGILCWTEILLHVGFHHFRLLFIDRSSHASTSCPGITARALGVNGSVGYKDWKYWCMLLFLALYSFILNSLQLRLSTFQPPSLLGSPAPGLKMGWLQIFRLVVLCKFNFSLHMSSMELTIASSLSASVSVLALPVLAISAHLVSTNTIPSPCAKMSLATSIITLLSLVPM